MHSAEPYGLHNIGLEPTDKDLAFISSAALKLSNLKQLSGIDTLKMVYSLPDGGYVILQDAGGNFRVITHKQVPQKEVVASGIATSFVPMLFSGAVTQSILYENQGVTIRLTESARHRLRNYDNEKPLPDKELELQRFRIDYSDRFREFKPKDEKAIFRAQYTELRPTWYSGAMAEVMQIVGGYGRQNISELPDNEYERARLLIPKDVLGAINEQLGNTLLPGYTGLPNEAGEFQYDYKFNKTNAIGFDEDKKPWLIEVSSRGVHAMPLPLIAATTTLAFRSYIEKIGDDEIIKILDRFGGMPSGETFPEGASFQAWKRAGVIIYICSSHDFYTNIAYSSACGWSFNSDGVEAFNTCYNYNDEEGLAYGLTYKLKLGLGRSILHYGIVAPSLNNSDSKYNKVAAYLTKLSPLLASGTNESRAIKFKLRLASIDDIYNRAIAISGDQDYDYWNNLELEPIATHTGTLGWVSRGYLYHGAPFKNQPQIKFPEPLLQACVSHDFLPLINGRGKPSYPNSDTIMYAYYVGNSLKVVKYFMDWNSFTRGTTGNFEKYMRVGSWFEESYDGPTSIQGEFYSTDIDDRYFQAPNTTSTWIVGKDEGYDSVPRFSFDYIFSMSGTLFRYKFYSHKTTTLKTTDKRTAVSVCMPYFTRNAVIQTTRTDTAIKEESQGLSLYSVTDPITYRYWTYDSVWAWTNMTIKNPKGSPEPKSGSPVWVEEENYNPSEESDFADNGSWISGLPQDYTWLIHPNNNEWLNRGGGSAPTINEYSTYEKTFNDQYGSMFISMVDQPDVVNKEVPAKGYYMSSPSEFGDFFYTSACMVVFGNTIYRSVTENGLNNTAAFWGSTELIEHGSSAHFIGVINE